MSLDSYFNNIDSVLNHPLIREVRCQKEKRSSAVGLIVAKVTFTDDSELHIMEYLEAEAEVERKTYRYHYQTHQKQMIFRYDNAAHHPEIPTYPDHRHADSGISESHKPDIEEVISEIASQYIAV